MIPDIFNRSPIRMDGPIYVFEDDPDPGFETRWLEHPEVQATTAGMFEDKTTWPMAELAGLIVLDAGCGCGRFAAVALAAGAHVVAVDASLAALRATAINCDRWRDRLTLVQADLMDLPLREQILDRAWSIGVLHHTRVPALSFAQVAQTIRSGGQLAVWVYSQPVPDRWLPAVELLHEITRACPPAALYAAIRHLGLRVRDSYVGDKGAGILSQVLRISGSPDVRECWSDTLDWHAPQYRSWHTEDEVRGWFREAGMRPIKTGNMPVSVTGVKD